MLEARGDERLPHEASRVRGGRGLELLQGDRAAEAPVARGQDAAHAAPRELALDRVVLAADDGQPRRVGVVQATRFRRDRGNEQLPGRHGGSGIVRPASHGPILLPRALLETPRERFP